MSHGTDFWITWADADNDCCLLQGHVRLCNLQQDSVEGFSHLPGSREASCVWITTQHAQHETPALRVIPGALHRSQDAIPECLQ